MSLDNFQISDFFNHLPPQCDETFEKKCQISFRSKAVTEPVSNYGHAAAGGGVGVLIKETDTIFGHLLVHACTETLNSVG